MRGLRHVARQRRDAGELALTANGEKTRPAWVPGVRGFDSRTGPYNSVLTVKRRAGSVAYAATYADVLGAHTGPVRTFYGSGRTPIRAHWRPVVNLRARPFGRGKDQIFRPNRADEFSLFIRETGLSFKVFAGIVFSLAAPGAGGTRPGAHNRVSHSTEIFYATLEKGASK